MYEALAKVPAAGNVDIRPPLLNAFTGDLSIPPSDTNGPCGAKPERVGRARRRRAPPAHQPTAVHVANGATAAVLLQLGPGRAATASQARDPERPPIADVTRPHRSRHEQRARV